MNALFMKIQQHFIHEKIAIPKASETLDFTQLISQLSRGRTPQQ